MWPTPAVAISGKSLTRGSELSAPTDGCGLKGLLPSMVCAAMQQKKARSLLLAEIRRSHLTAEKKDRSGQSKPTGLLVASRLAPPTLNALPL